MLWADADQQPPRRHLDPEPVKDDQRTGRGGLTPTQIELLRRVESTADSIALVDRLRRVRHLVLSDPAVTEADAAAVRAFMMRSAGWAPTS